MHRTRSRRRSVRALLGSSPRWVVAIAVASGWALAAFAPAVGQERSEPASIKWWHPVVAGAGTAALFLIDEPIQDFIQDNRTEGLDDIGNVTKEFKDPVVFAVSGFGAIAVGLVASEPKVTVTGLHIITAYGLSSAMMIGTKWALGRARPSDTPDDATNFDLFNGTEDSAFPSGSAAVVFSLATTLADAIDRWPASVLLYTGATLNAWARVNSNRHWFSDVALGALYGITAAKLVNGEWSIFGLQLPSAWTDGRSAGLQYSLRLRGP